VKYFSAISIAAFFICVFAVCGYTQNRFEGYNIILNVPENQTSTACALRYMPPATEVRVSDLDTRTPMKLIPCSGGAGAGVTQVSATTATLRASSSDFKWCFQGEDKRYRISFAGDRLSGPITYDWIAAPDERTAGMYNVRDFGALGDGRAEDTIAIQSALAYVATRNGGVLFFPEGDYHVGRSPDFRGLTLPSGVTIQGVAGLHTGAASENVVKNNPSRITLEGANRDLFRIGECTAKVNIKDIELLAQSQQNTVAVHALGAYQSSENFYFDNVSFSSFWRGIYAHGLPQTNLQWQFDYIQIDRCRFIFNADAGIYTNSRNSDWRISNSLFINPRRTNTQRADSMYFERAAGVYIDNTTGGGFPQAIGGTFLNILDSGHVLVSHSQTESMTNSLVYNEVRNPEAGDYSHPIIFLNSAFGAPMVFNARRTFVSTGNSYGSNTFKADAGLRVYSTGDRFCYDGWIIGCQTATNNLFDKATIVFMTGQPAEGRVAGNPAVFGTDVLFNSSVRLQPLQITQLPQDKPDGSLLYCANCRRSTTPCQGGGSGAPAMKVAGQWSCL
jgi:hypothetical protein